MLGRIARPERQMLLPGYGSLLVSLQLGGIAIFGSIWLRTRTQRQRSERELRLLDTSIISMPTLVVGTALWHSPIVLRPEMMVLLATCHVLMTRAVIIPSSPLRTFGISLAAEAIMTAGTYAFYFRAATPHLPAPWWYALVVFAWSSASTVVSTITSYTIYGLRARLVSASQLGQYTLEKKIGEGGMGIVYRARHAMLRRPTAIKLLPPDRAGEQNLVRFEREVQHTSMLTHPNTIAIYDFGRTPEGVFYYAMEYLDGIDLEDLVNLDGPQQPRAVVVILQQICGALAEAHGAGLIHRDVKPANVLLCERGGVPGVAKVVDFGLVKNVHTEDTRAPNLSNVGAIMGTPLYLSPEAISRPGTVDARSDLYAVGAVGYYLLTGQHVFNADTVVGVCIQHLQSEPEPPSKRLQRPVPPELEAIVLGCLEKDVARRPQSALELTERLGALGYDWPASARREWWSRLMQQRIALETQAPARNSSVTPARTVAIAWDKRP